MTEDYKENNLVVTEDDSVINVFKENRCIRMSQKHKFYLPDILNFYDSYFSGVEYENVDGYELVDFSKAKFHKVVGYDLHEIMFPAFVEPVETSNQYVTFADLNEESIVFDLGAYSGLTSILFDREISKNNKKASGKVIAVDADLYNTECIENNFKLYKEKAGRCIEYLFGAVWNKNGELEFSNESNMGSAAAGIVGKNRGLVNKVKSYTLSSIAQKYNLKKVDFIKCDIEGAEIFIFEDKEFFKKYSPKIIVESHPVENPYLLV